MHPVRDHLKIFLTEHPDRFDANGEETDHFLLVGAFQGQADREAARLLGRDFAENFVTEQALTRQAVLIDHMDVALRTNSGFRRTALAPGVEDGDNRCARWSGCRNVALESLDSTATSPGPESKDCQEAKRGTLAANEPGE